MSCIDSYFAEAGDRKVFKVTKLTTNLYLAPDQVAKARAHDLRSPRWHTTHEPRTTSTNTLLSIATTLSNVQADESDSSMRLGLAPDNQGRRTPDEEDE
jgi:hypothetical protein